MSDISALSNDYEETSHFAERVNNAVLVLKRIPAPGGAAP